MIRLGWFENSTPKILKQMLNFCSDSFSSRLNPTLLRQQEIWAHFHNPFSGSFLRRKMDQRAFLFRFCQFNWWWIARHLPSWMANINHCKIMANFAKLYPVDVCFCFKSVRSNRKAFNVTQAQTNEKKSTLENLLKTFVMNCFQS